MDGADPKLRAKLLGSLRDEVDLFDRNVSVYVNLVEEHQNIVA